MFTTESLFCGSCDCDMDVRCADLNGVTVLVANEKRRVWACRCLVTGEGLLVAVDGTRRSPAGTDDFLRGIGLVVIMG